jgi:hypothetical protein
MIGRRSAVTLMAAGALVAGCGGGSGQRQTDGATGTSTEKREGGTTETGGKGGRRDGHERAERGGGTGTSAQKGGGGTGSAPAAGEALHPDQVDALKGRSDHGDKDRRARGRAAPRVRSSPKAWFRSRWARVRGARLVVLLPVAG